MGRVWPNPAVGCVIVKDGRVVGRGWTQPGGRPHAETEALARAGTLADGATLYTTLEPCSHHGKTPPCADAVDRRRHRAASSWRSRIPIRASKAAASPGLRAAGIAVEIGLGAAEAAEINAGFLMRLATGRPLVTLEAGDARSTARSRWRQAKAVGSPAKPRAAARHLLRASHDAVMIGIGTAIADDPELTCRLPGMADRHPVRIVVDPGLRLSLTARLVVTAAKIPTWIVTRGGGDRARHDGFRAAGVELIELRGKRRGHRSRRRAAQRWASAALPACWSKAAPAWRRTCCATIWSIGLPGSMRPP